MKIYNVTYQFETDIERGSSSVLYPSLRAALKEAKELYLSAERDEERWPDNDIQSDEPATVELATLWPLTPATMCEIINTEGERWQESSTPIGVIRWDPDRKRARFEKTAE